MTRVLFGCLACGRCVGVDQAEHKVRAWTRYHLDHCGPLTVFLQGQLAGLYVEVAPWELRTWRAA